MTILGCDFVAICLRIAQIREIKLNEEDKKKLNEVASEAAKKMSEILEQRKAENMMDGVPF
ncbi:hypothetical protein HYT00_03180 [Candidatus Giovannonibacteria bacterium]|nr:hypothetical protein [Candidatus Giovannonibacteria bacterium]